MFPKELEDIFNEFEEDDFNLCIIRADFSRDNIIIEFELSFQVVNGGPSQQWTIEAIGHVKNQVFFGRADYISIAEDHPLLWQFTDTQCQLYFIGQCEDTAKMFCDLYDTHKRLFGSYECFNISFGDKTVYSERFKYTNGLLTQGPKKLMIEYSDRLKENGMDFTIIGERQPKELVELQAMPKNPDLKVLFLGDTFVIAKAFSFVRYDENGR